MSTELKDIKLPVDIPSQLSWLWITLTVLALVVLIALVVVWYLRKPKKQAVIEVNPLTAWEKAYARLDNLKLKKLIERPSLKPFYIELSDIIRHYLEERFSLKAPEMTTEEFLESLRTMPVLNEVQKQMLEEFLRTCDMVKFAKHQPSVQEAEKSFELIKALIGQTHGI